MIGVIGSGNVGANTAFFLAERGVDDVRLYDVQEGVAKGKALDMMEAAPIRGYRTKISGVDSLGPIKEADVIVVAAGSVRKPGMRREDLLEANRGAVSAVARELRGYAGKVIVVTEPVDLLTTLFLRESELPPAHVLGLGGCLDSTRLRYLLAEELSVSPDNVTALVVGRHSDGMIPLADYCRVSGVPVDRLLGPERIQALFAATRDAGSLIVDLAQRASAFYGPSAVAADLAEAIVQDKHSIASVSLMFTGQYGIEGVAMSLPAVIGRGGIEKVLSPRLTGIQEELLRMSAEDLRRILAERA
jgi:malate dehydrogenase